MYVAYRGHVLRRLVTPRWLGALLLAAVMAWTCYHLGWWQYHRYEAKQQRNERLDTHYRATPVPLPSVLTPAGLDPEDEWTRVTVSGQYAGGPVYVRNRPLESEPGYEVLWALRPASGGPDVVVDRGWVAASLGSGSVLPGYLLLQSETLPDGTSPPRPQALGDPDRDLGPHQAYAYQWWLLMVMGFVLIPFGIRRELRLEDPEKYPAKPKKTRIWDEEDE